MVASVLHAAYCRDDRWGLGVLALGQHQVLRRSTPKCLSIATPHHFALRILRFYPQMGAAQRPHAGAVHSGTPD